MLLWLADCAMCLCHSTHCFFFLPWHSSLPCNLRSFRQSCIKKRRLVHALTEAWSQPHWRDCGTHAAALCSSYCGFLLKAFSWLCAASWCVSVSYLLICLQILYSVFTIGMNSGQWEKVLNTGTNIWINWEILKPSTPSPLRLVEICLKQPGVIPVSSEHFMYAPSDSVGLVPLSCKTHSAMTPCPEQHRSGSRQYFIMPNLIIWRFSARHPAMLLIHDSAATTNICLVSW